MPSSSSFSVVLAARYNQVIFATEAHEFFRSRLFPYGTPLLNKAESRGGSKLPDSPSEMHMAGHAVFLDLCLRH